MERTRSISKSMMSYLKRAREHKEFLLKETQEFERGKRHLANIMGIETGQMNQENIDHAIKYLFPSGLFEPKARPMMKHPDILYEAKKEAQFDEDGRPYHHLFYTIYPNYYELLGKVTSEYHKINEYEDEQLANGILDSPDDARYIEPGRIWLTLEEIQSKLIEPIKPHDYEYLIRCLERLKSHPYSNQVKGLLDDMTKPLESQDINLKLPELIQDEETGQLYTSQDIKAREHVINVKTVLNGTGKIKIDGDHDILYFPALYMRRAIFFPLDVTNMLDKVDITATIVRKPITLGLGVMAYAIRYGVSTSIAAFKGPEVRERLRLAGLLTKDYRRKERKKFGQEGARRKYTWKKR